MNDAWRRFPLGFPRSWEPPVPFDPRPSPFRETGSLVVKDVSRVQAEWDEYDSLCKYRIDLFNKRRDARWKDLMRTAEYLKEDRCRHCGVLRADVPDRYGFHDCIGGRRDIPRRRRIGRE